MVGWIQCKSSSIHHVQSDMNKMSEQVECVPYIQLGVACIFLRKHSMTILILVILVLVEDVWRI